MSSTTTNSPQATSAAAAPQLTPDQVWQPKVSRIGAAGLTAELLAISIWLGGLLMIGAVVAPVAFQAVGAVPQLAGNLAAQKALAGTIVGNSLRIFNIVTLFCALVLAVGMSLRDNRLRRFATYKFACVLLVGLIASVISLAFVIFPDMDKARDAGAMRLFDHYHRIYERVSQIQLGCLFVYLGCYAWLKSIRMFDD